MRSRGIVGPLAATLLATLGQVQAQETADFGARRRELTRAYQAAGSAEEKRAVLERMRALDLEPVAPPARTAPGSSPARPAVRAALDARDRGAIERLVASGPGGFEAATPEERAAMVDLLQRGGTGEKEERAIETILASTPPLARAEVLRRIDLGDDKYDLDELVFHDVDDAGRRERILALIDEAAEALEASGGLELGVISDIDDTALPLKDRPESLRGAALFYRFLEDGPGGDGKAGDVHFVTARPPIVLGDMRGRLARAGFPAATLEDGDLGRAVFGGKKGIEREKVEDIERLLRLHPRQRFVLLGDDRDRDPEVFRTILERHPDRIRAAFVRFAGGKPRRVPDFPGIVFVDRYDEAAEELRVEGIFGSDHLAAIREEVDRAE